LIWIGLLLKRKRCGRLVCLRSMVEADAVPYVRWLRDPEIAVLVGAEHVPSVEERVEQLQAFRASAVDLVLGVEVKSTLRLIGTIALRDIDWVRRVAEAAVFIGEKAHWGKGYGTEAMTLLLKIGFKELNLRRIQLHVEPSNLRARHVFEKVGFKEEGTSREFIVMVKESSS